MQLDILANSIVFLITIYTLNKLFVRYTFLNKYKTYIELFSYFAEEAFQIIYKDQVSGYSINGHTIQGDELETAKRNYVKIFFELMGSNNSKSLSKFYGNRNTLVTNMLIYFQNKIVDDEIMKIVNDDVDKKR